MSKTKREICEHICNWVHEHEGKCPATVADDYPKLMRHVLKAAFDMPEKAAEKFVRDACYGNWKRLHETGVEEQADVHVYAGLLLSDLWYVSDRLSWDRVLRIQWLYQRLLHRCDSEFY